MLHLAHSADTDDDVISHALTILASRICTGTLLTSANATRDYLRLKYSATEHEVFGAIFLDNRHRVLAIEELFHGTLNGTAVYPREIIKRALTLNAAALMFFHNHPSGCAEPSRADETMTQTLIAAAKTVDITVLDHLIVGTEGTTSFAERGLI